ncbi:hypothetical protein WR25_25878 [Diploscapter pachys]|uniref:Uncharacterized protein n=1 Tax=Diploscapter pachys TaxID=2018661 RepID=A0A2A2KCI4_9BILA|nr:hypothetical protein WR25_25878 [Diploscapter pachys]
MKSAVHGPRNPSATRLPARTSPSPPASSLIATTIRSAPAQVPPTPSARTCSSICASTACAARVSANSRNADRLDLEKKCWSARVASCGR